MTTSCVGGATTIPWECRAQLFVTVSVASIREYSGECVSSRFEVLCSCRLDRSSPKEITTPGCCSDTGHGFAEKGEGVCGRTLVTRSILSRLDVMCRVFGIWTRCSQWFRVYAEARTRVIGTRNTARERKWCKVKVKRRGIV